MIAGRMRADQVAPVFRSSNLSDRQTRTARENGADPDSRLLPGDWDDMSDGSCRLQSWAEWTVACFRGRPRDAESGPLTPDVRPGSSATPLGPCLARVPRGFHWRVEPTAAERKLAIRLPASRSAAGHSDAPDPDARRSRCTVSGGGTTAFSLRQPIESRALGRHLRRRAM